MLHMTARVIWGPLKVPSGHAHEPLPHGAAVYDPATSRHYHEDETGDLTGREVAILIPLAIAVVLLGVLPTPMLDSILRPIQALRTPVSNVQPQTAVAVGDIGR